MLLGSGSHSYWVWSKYYLRGFSLFGGDGEVCHGVCVGRKDYGEEEVVDFSHDKTSLGDVGKWCYAAFVMVGFVRRILV